MSNKKCIRVGKYEISCNCFGTYPCAHWVTYNKTEPFIMTGIQIYEMLRKEGLSDPHFDTYRCFASAFTASARIPPPEIIKQKNIWQRMICCFCKNN